MYRMHAVAPFGTVFSADGCALDASNKSVKRSVTSKNHRPRIYAWIVPEILLIPAVTVAVCSKIRVFAPSVFGVREKFKNQLTKRKYGSECSCGHQPIVLESIGQDHWARISASLIHASNESQLGLEF